jgi:hypothetical protein
MDFAPAATSKRLGSTSLSFAVMMTFADATVLFPKGIFG